mgnify:CR=1 FL=1
MNRGQFFDQSGRLIIEDMLRATNAWERARGLLGRALQKNQGLWIEPCSSVHTIGMGYHLDLVYLDSGSVIVKTVEHLAPWRISGCRRAHSTLELTAGFVRAQGLTKGMQLDWVDSP